MLNSSLLVLGCSAALSVSVVLPSLAAEQPAGGQPAAPNALKTLSLDGVPDVWLQGQPVKEWEKDKVYIFEFWATWCGPCLAAMPHMEELHQKFKGKPNFQIVGVNVMDRKTPDALKEFLKARPTQLNYTMAVDVEGKKTGKHWLEPQGVKGIPHVFAVKNGQLIWRGHPAGLNEKMITAMLAPDFTPDSLKGAEGASTASSQEEFYRNSSKFAKLMAEKKWDEAKAFGRQIISKDTLSEKQLLSLKAMPFKFLAEQGQYKEAQAVQAKLTSEYPDNYNVQMSAASEIMNMIPVDSMDAALVEQCLMRGIDISKKANKEASLPWRMMAELRERQGNKKEALANMMHAISRSSLGQAWDTLQKLSGKEESLQSVVDQVAVNLKPIPVRNRQELGSVKEDAVLSPVFNKLAWLNHDAIMGLPANKTVFIDFWRIMPGRGPMWGEQAPGTMVDLVLEKHGLLDHPNIKTIVLSVNPFDKDKAEQYLATPAMKSIYPVGVPSDDSVVELFKSYKMQYFPSVAVVRDGKLLWAGETKRMPEWLFEVAVRDNFDPKQFEAEAAARDVEHQEMAKVLNKSVELREQKQYDAYEKLIEDNAARFAKNGMFASTVAEMQAGRAFKAKDYKKAAAILDDLMTRFPQDDAQASYLLKLLSNSDEMKDNSYDARRHAMQVMRSANTRGDGGYDAACYEYMMKMAMEKKDYGQARKDALNAFNDLPMVRQYAEMLKKQ